MTISWVVSTPFGWPVEPEANRILAPESGVMAAKARSTSGPGTVAGRSRRLFAPAGPARHDDGELPTLASPASGLGYDLFAEVRTSSFGQNPVE